MKAMKKFSDVLIKNNIPIPDLFGNPFDPNEFNIGTIKQALKDVYGPIKSKMIKDLNAMTEKSKEFKSERGLLSKTIKQLQEEIVIIKRKIATASHVAVQSQRNPVVFEQLNNDTINNSNTNPGIGKRKRLTPGTNIDPSLGMNPMWGWTTPVMLPHKFPIIPNSGGIPHDGDKPTSKQGDKDSDIVMDNTTAPTVPHQPDKLSEYFDENGNPRYSTDPWRNPGLYDSRFYLNPGLYTFPYMASTRRRLNGDIIVPVKNAITSRLNAIDPTQRSLLSPSTVIVEFSLF